MVGAGVVGMSTAAVLLDAGHQVTTYDSGSIMGARSAGSSRIFRLAHVDPDLVRLAQRARLGFDRWSERAGRPMLRAAECVITGTDMVDRAAAMAAAGAPYELVEAGSGRLRLPVRDEPITALIDLGGGVVDVDAVRGTRLAVDPTVLESLYCTTMPGAGDGVHTRRNGPVVALYGDNLMKLAPVLGEALAEAVTDAGGTGPS